jgi:hypothetical protein
MKKLIVLKNVYSYVYNKNQQKSTPFMMFSVTYFYELRNAISIYSEC